MDLFSSGSSDNLLPYDGTVHYYGPVLSKEDADFYFEKMLHSIEWRQDEAIIYGKHIITRRKVAWYGDGDFNYTYSNTSRKAIPWTKDLLNLKAIVEKETRIKFNSCLLNLYHNGEEGMSWHSDDERSLGVNTVIASVSLGAERKFSFKHKKTKESISLILQHGSLLVMKGTTQENWLHSLPKTKKVTRPRVNLTFRTFIA